MMPLDILLVNVCVCVCVSYGESSSKGTVSMQSKLASVVVCIVVAKSQSSVPTMLVLCCRDIHASLIV